MAFLLPRGRDSVSGSRAATAAVKRRFFSILAGVNRPDRGSICFDGMEAVGNRKVFERNAAYVPQENPLIPELTARDNYRLWFKGDKAELERDLEEGVGKFLGLTEFLGTPAGKLSGGQKKDSASHRPFRTRLPF